MVIHWPRFRKEVVFYGREQSTRNLGPYRGKDVAGIRRKHVLRLHCPELNSEARDMENCRFTLLPPRKQLRLFFRILVSANQLSLYGTVANICEECESLHDRSGRLDKVMGQSIVLNEIKTEVHSENDDSAYENFLLQQYEERIERLSQPDKVSNFLMDAGFVSVVEIEQYFMTEDTGRTILCCGLS